MDYIRKNFHVPLAKNYGILGSREYSPTISVDSQIEFN
jgi:hypothetical protein